MNGTLYVLTGPSGVGKTTVAKELLARDAHLRKVVTYTTRPPRDGERDGVDYHFVTDADFERMIEHGDLFEWAKVYDRYYGSRTEDVRALLDAGRDVLMVIDVQGARSIKGAFPQAITIFLTAESPEVLLERLEHRDAGTTANLAERRAALEVELAYAAECDHTVVNADDALAETVRKISGIMEQS